MSFFSSLGKIILGLVVFGIVIGGAGMYFYFIHIAPQINKLSELDKINTELENTGQEKISMNILTGELSR